MLISSSVALFVLLNVAVRETKAVRYAPEVTLKSGKIRGLLADLNTGGTVRKYLGIPYGTAQRFQAPTDPESWTGVKDTISSGKRCPQMPSKHTKFADMIEDCLHLNVFVPHGAGSSLPVMVWVHGGGFVFGSNRIYDGSYIATLGKVIVVAMNYRLNAFGFLATGKDGLKGNYGMLDQVHSLKWVKDNIKSFGGDPGKVTIFGESSGGASVGLLVLSPMTKGLFQRAILQSGDANAVWAYRTYNKEILGIAKVIASEGGCASIESLGDCLKDKSFEQVLNASKKILDIGESVFRPVVDGEFLPDSPDVLLTSGKFEDIEIIIGFTNDEGTVITNAIPGMETTILVKNGFPRSNLIKLINDPNIKFARGQNPVINEAILYLYTDWNNITDPYRNRRMLLDMTADSMFVAPAVKSAKAIAKKTSKIYMYQLQYRFNTYFFQPIPSWVGAFHAADLVILFGQAFLQAASTNSSVYTKDANFTRAMITMWTNFAKSGDPNTPEPIGLAWPKYDTTQQKFMALKPMLQVQEKPRNSHVAFWNEFVPAALKAMPKPTTPPPCVYSSAKALTSGLMILINAVVWSLYVGW